MQFRTPEELWNYSMHVVALMGAGDLREAADILEHGVRYVTSSAREWLGELGRTAEAVSKRYRTPPDVREAPDTIIRTTRSKRPYGE
jgi:hypothetical protein